MIIILPTNQPEIILPTAHTAKKVSCICLIININNNKDITTTVSIVDFEQVIASREYIFIIWSYIHYICFLQIGTTTL